MKTKLIFLTIISHFIFMPVFSDQMDCTQFKKLSAKYIECEANNRLKLGKKKFEDSDMKNKIDKFKGSKTLSDLIKK